MVMVVLIQGAKLKVVLHAKVDQQKKQIHVFVQDFIMVKSVLVIA